MLSDVMATRPCRKLFQVSKTLKSLTHYIKIHDKLINRIDIIALLHTIFQQN